MAWLSDQEGIDVTGYEPPSFTLPALVALLAMVAMVVAFALADYWTAAGAMWIVAVGILTFGAVAYGQRVRLHR